MLGGLMNKAKRGELRITLPIGFVYDDDDKTVKDPDEEVQNSLHYFFEVFRRVGSAVGVSKFYEKENLLFPSRVRGGLHHGKLIRKPLSSHAALRILKNPCYAGAFVYGRIQRKGKTSRNVPREEWYTLLPNHHDGYITWEEYEENQKRLEENYIGRSAPREGPALLQGIVMCGICGNQMKVRYHHSKNQLIPSYFCQKEKGLYCQQISGKNIEPVISKKIIEIMAPLTLDLALNIEKEMHARFEDIDRLRLQKVERAEYEAERAKVRYMQVDPNNRFVANSLEVEWEEKLRAHQDALAEYNRQKEEEIKIISEEQEKKIRELTTEFPKVWNDPTTSDRERKKMLRMIIEDVTLSRKEDVVLQIRFKGGATETLRLPILRPVTETSRTDNEIVKEIERLTKKNTNSQVAEILNSRGLKTKRGLEFTGKAIRGICSRYEINSLSENLRNQGLLTCEELSESLGIPPSFIKGLHRQGKLKGYLCNDQGAYLYEKPEKESSRKFLECEAFGASVKV